jgi:hypothetical protein
MEARQLLMHKRMHTLVAGNSWAWVAWGATTFWLVTQAGSPTALAQSTAAGRANDYGFSQVSLINEQIRQGWIEQGLKPSEMATDGEWCRRVYLDILGRIPSVDELRRFTDRRDAAKKRKLVEELLEGDEYSEEYAGNWSTIWTNVLIGRSGGTEPNSLTNRDGMRDYLREAMAGNKPYDRLVYELVTATGATAPGVEGYNGAVNYLVMKVNDDKASQAAAMTAKIFLGLQVQCTQCHNHPFNDWKQRKFWEMNAFFRQTRAERRNEEGTGRVAYAQLVDTDFPGEGSTPREAEIYYELRNGEMEVAYPVFVDGTAIGRSGVVSEVNRREELGQLIVNSPMLEKTLVNRLWAHFLGYGFTKPVDDLGPHNLPSHPKLLDALAAEFRQGSFNLKNLMRWITLSQPYALSSRANDSNAVADDPLLGETPKFSRFYMRQMEAEELYESLLVATAAHKTRGEPAEQEEAKSRWLRQFTITFGTDDGGETTTFNGTIPQALMMFNGEFIQKAISLEPGNILHDVAANDWKPLDKVHYLFEAGLARKATRDEVAMSDQLLVARQGNVGEALRDVWWAILNSNEFLMNH